MQSNNRVIIKLLIITLLLSGFSAGVIASEKITVNTGVDFYNRYVWRGLDIANTPSIQPALSVAYGGLEIGTWGAYTLSNESSEADEVDFWASYTVNLKNGVSITAIATDYYFPNAGVELFNFNNHDAFINDTVPDPGAHTLELGLSITGPEAFPVTLSGYLNVYNDAGSNTYFQVDCPITVGETELGLFCGMTGGSQDNPDYYGSDEFSAINIGVTAIKEIKMSNDFSLPLTISLIVNPRTEMSHLIVGMSF